MCSVATFDLRFRLRVRFRIRRMNIILNTMYMIWYKICTGYIIYTTYDSSPPSCGLLVEISDTSLRIKDECLIFMTTKICSNVDKLTRQKKIKTETFPY